MVGAGYTGTEVAAQGALLTRRALQRRPELRGHQARWVLLDLASPVLPGLSAELSGPAASVLRRRGVDVRLGQTVTEVASDCTVLSDGAKLPAYTVVWCVGSGMTRSSAHSACLRTTVGSWSTRSWLCLAIQRSLRPATSRPYLISPGQAR